MAHSCPVPFAIGRPCRYVKPSAAFVALALPDIHPSEEQFARPQPNVDSTDMYCRRRHLLLLSSRCTLPRDEFIAANNVRLANRRKRKFLRANHAAETAHCVSWVGLTQEPGCTSNAICFFQLQTSRAMAHFCHATVDAGMDGYGLL